MKLEIGKEYNWKDKPVSLIYLGYNFNGETYLHQFALTSAPNIAWCECNGAELSGIEETNKGVI